MKTFKTYLDETPSDALNPQFAYGGSSTGPGLGQYDPIADLNAQRQFLGTVKSLNLDGNNKEIKKSDLDQIEKYADRLFGALDIDVEFTRHFLDRVNDIRNQRQITSAELTRLFKQTYKKHGKTIRKLGPDAEAVINDMKTDINMPFALNLKGGELELVAKTVMRKKNFKTSNPKLSFEEISEGRAKRAVAGGKVQKLVTAFGYSFKGKNYKEIDMELVSIDNSSQIVTFNIIHPPEIFGNEIKIPFRALRRGRYMATDTSKINEVRTKSKVPSQVQRQLMTLYTAYKKEKKGSKEAKSMLNVINDIRTRVKLPQIDDNLDVVESRTTEYVKDIAHTMRGKGHENLKKYADDFEKNALKSKDPRKELNKIPNINPKQVANLLNMGDNPRIPRKKGQPAGSDKHSDLYTDENPRGTIHGLGFKDVATAKASVKKIEGSGKTHAHKIQAAIAMEQRARVMGKTAEAAIYRTYINKMKKKTKQMQKEEFEFFPKKIYERIKLPDPPSDLEKEIKNLKILMQSRTKEDEESIRNHDEHSFYAIEKYCEKHGLIFHNDEMKDIVMGAKDTIGYFKKLFNFPRPFHVDKTIKPMVGSTTNKTKSYPSGHACQSMLVALYVSSKFPEHEKGVMEAAKECGMGRVLAGFHYVADYHCGNLLANKMFLVMNRDNYGKNLKGE